MLNYDILRTRRTVCRPRAQSELYHDGVKGMKWGQRRYRNYDGTLTELGKKQYGWSTQEASKLTDKAQRARRLALEAIETKQARRVDKIGFKKDKLIGKIQDSEEQRRKIVSKRNKQMAKLEELQKKRPGNTKAIAKTQKKIDNLTEKHDNFNVKQNKKLVRQNKKVAKLSNKMKTEKEVLTSARRLQSNVEKADKLVRRRERFHINGKLEKAAAEGLGKTAAGDVISKAGKVASNFLKTNGGKIGAVALGAAAVGTIYTLKKESDKAKSQNANLLEDDDD